MQDNTTNHATKHCSRCNTTKPTSEFRSNRSRKDGLSAYCAVCNFAYQQSYREANSETRLAQKKQYRQENKQAIFESNKRYVAQNPEKKRLSDLNWRLENKERKRENDRRYRETHEDRVKAQKRANTKKRYKNNPLQWRAYDNIRRTRLAGNGGYFTAKDIRNMQYIQQGHCCYCGRIGLPFAIDHIISVVDGGPSDPWNLALACRDCNLNKGRKSLHNWVDRWYLK